MVVITIVASYLATSRSFKQVRRVRGEACGTRATYTFTDSLPFIHEGVGGAGLSIHGASSNGSGHAVSSVGRNIKNCEP